MITPEFIREQQGEFVFVANHALSSPQQVSQSIEYNLARIEHARKHLPRHLAVCRLIYDIRGQHVSSEQIDRLSSTLGEVGIVEFMR